MIATPKQPRLEVAQGSDPTASPTSSDALPKERSPWGLSATTLAQEVASYARGRNSQLMGVGLRLPENIDEEMFLAQLGAQLEARGLHAPHMSVTIGAGAPQLMSVEFRRHTERGPK